MVCRDTHWLGAAAVRVTVRDSGPGLTPEARERVFEPLYTTRHSGLGLGMAIVRRIVEAHGGRIDVGDSGVLGAEFVITLPRVTPGQAMQPRCASAAPLRQQGRSSPGSNSNSARSASHAI